MIGMKILFWFLGLILGILAALVGIVIGMVCAPFIFHFIMGSMRKAIKNGTESDFVDYL
jgi:ABC-type lipoprotein release transport system permease subunit